ncbi:MAG: DUF2336 domain-containing protein [Alphaproteobacteria bacterium]|nr:DUF2336 domain-containing protein [Alphaproteobacteria bacterium]
MSAAARHATNPAEPVPGYDEAKRLARSTDATDRQRLAESESSLPEILYYLTADPAVEVRRAIASNPATPRQADLVLAGDSDQGVRESLATKIARVLPHLSRDEQDAVYRTTVQVLEKLANDQAAHVRQILAEALKTMAEAPAEVIGRLARDVELGVAAPVLEFSPLLSEDDLIEIIAAGPAQGALNAISRRVNVGGRVADAIVGKDDADAIAALLGNASAQIREETLDRIVDKAPRHEAWHEPLVRRPRLPAGMVRRISRFVADSLLSVLRDRSDLDPTTAAALAAEVDKRLEQDAAEPRPDGKPTGGKQTGAETAQERAAAMHKKGELDEDAVLRAVNTGERPFALAALAVRSGINQRTIEHLFTLRSAKGVVSLAWKCGFTMRLATQLQMRMAGIPPQQVLRARAGVEFPLSKADMNWQIEFIEGLGKG